MSSVRERIQKAGENSYANLKADIWRVAKVGTKLIGRLHHHNADHTDLDVCRDKFKQLWFGEVDVDYPELEIAKRVANYADKREDIEAVIRAWWLKHDRKPDIEILAIVTEAAWVNAEPRRIYARVKADRAKQARAKLRKTRFVKTFNRAKDELMSNRVGVTYQDKHSTAGSKIVAYLSTTEATPLEIAKAVNRSRSAVRKALSRLLDAGQIRRTVDGNYTARGCDNPV